MQACFPLLLSSSVLFLSKCLAYLLLKDMILRCNYSKSMSFFTVMAPSCLNGVSRNSDGVQISIGVNAFFSAAPATVCWPFWNKNIYSVTLLNFSPRFLHHCGIVFVHKCMQKKKRNQLHDKYSGLVASLIWSKGALSYVLSSSGII